jgi:hypothetical protein
MITLARKALPSRQMSVSGRLRMTSWCCGIGPALIIEQEVASQGGQSVQQKVETELAKSDAGIVFCDHGSGEVADYVVITERSDATVFVFYHCKGSGAPRPSAGLEDVYEVCSQAQKSVPWSRVTRLASRLPNVRI